jgi:hypothetical protein
VKSPPDTVDAWLRHDALSSDADLVDRLVRYSVESGWRCVLALHRLSEASASDVGLARWFGPIERLLYYHGDSVKDRLMDLARRDTAFRARLAPLADNRTVAPEIIDAIGAVCGWQRRSRARHGNPEIDRAVNMADLDVSPPMSKDDWIVIDRPRGDAEFARLASAWLEREALQWSSEEVFEVVTGADPKRGWDLILNLVEEAPTDDALGSIGAGPIENFLGLNGEAWIVAIEAKAASDPKFCYALSHAWQGRTPDPVWDRIRHVTAERRRDHYFEPPPQE